MPTIANLRKTHCIRGHEIAVVGRYKNGRCAACARDDHREYLSRPEIVERLREKRRSPEYREYWANWREVNRDQVRADTRRRIHARRLKEQFGLDREDYFAMLDAQGGVCAICGMPPPEDYALSIDHDHATGIIRGLLCRQCNLGIGNLRDDPRLLKAAIKYLEGRR